MNKVTKNGIQGSDKTGLAYFLFIILQKQEYREVVQIMVTLKMYIWSSYIVDQVERPTNKRMTHKKPVLCLLYSNNGSIGIAQCCGKLAVFFLV